MKKLVFFVMILLISVGLVNFENQELLAAETVKIGYNAPLSGPAAAWGLPGLEGVGIWLDKINGAGGIRVGDKSYKVEIIKYDNEAIGSKALLGARKLVLEDNVVAMLMLGGATSSAVQPFLTKHKIITFVLIASDIAPDRPYLMDVTDNFPVYHLLHTAYIAKAHPKAKTAAIVSQDDQIGLAGIAWSEAGFEAAGINMVYSKPFAVETTDFAPIVSAVLPKNPEIISMGATYPEFQALIVEQLYTQGWKGILTSACWDYNAIVAKVPKEFVAGAILGFPDFDDPKLTKEHHEFWNEWRKRYPEPHGFSDITWEYAAALDVWKYGVQLAGSVKPEEVFKALKAAKTVPHSFGPGVWWGKEVFGMDNLLVPTWPMTEVQVNGKPLIVDWMNALDWIKQGNNREILFKTLKRWGVKTYDK
jgi:branched-chain amino acid transport system substrate-binding protein